MTLDPTNTNQPVITATINYPSISGINSPSISGIYDIQVQEDKTECGKGIVNSNGSLTVSMDTTSGEAVITLENSSPVTTVLIGDTSGAGIITYSGDISPPHTGGSGTSTITLNFVQNTQTGYVTLTGSGTYTTSSGTSSTGRCSGTISLNGYSTGS